MSHSPNYSWSVVVNYLPPYKQTSAGKKEKRNQDKRTNLLKDAAKATSNSPCFETKKFKVDIYYSRCKGKADSGNIIGGILDALVDIIYKDDRQVVDINYREFQGSKDFYMVAVTELPF